MPPLYRTEAILKMLAGIVGEYITLEMRTIPTEESDFSRVRVNLESRKIACSLCHVDARGARQGDDPGQVRESVALLRSLWSYGTHSS